MLLEIKYIPKPAQQVVLPVILQLNVNRALGYKEQTDRVSPLVYAHARQDFMIYFQIKQIAKVSIFFVYHLITFIRLPSNLLHMQFFYLVLVLSWDTKRFKFATL